MVLPGATGGCPAKGAAMGAGVGTGTLGAPAYSDLEFAFLAFSITLYSCCHLFFSSVHPFALLYSFVYTPVPFYYGLVLRLFHLLLAVFLVHQEKRKDPPPTQIFFLQ